MNDQIKQIMIIVLIDPNSLALSAGSCCSRWRSDVRKEGDMSPVSFNRPYPVSQTPTNVLSTKLGSTNFQFNYMIKPFKKMT